MMSNTLQQKMNRNTGVTMEESVLSSAVMNIDTDYDTGDSQKNKFLTFAIINKDSAG